MVGQLPQELIDLVVNFLPLDISLIPTPDYFGFRRNVINCTLVSRAFSRPARRRLFEKIKFGPVSRLIQLEKILEDEYIRLSVRFLHIVIDEFDYDLEVVEMDDSNLAHTIGALVSCNVRHLELQAGSEEAVFSEDRYPASFPILKKLVTHLDVLTLRGELAVSSSLLEHKTHLKRLQMLGGSLMEKPAAHLPQTQVEELFIRPGTIVAVSSATSSLPTFSAARIEFFLDEQEREPIVPLLAQSSLSLQTLEIITLARWFPSGFDFSRFQNLRTIRYCIEYNDDVADGDDVVALMMNFLDKIAQQLKKTPSSSVEELEVKLTVVEETDLCEIVKFIDNNEETPLEVWRTYLSALEPAHLRSTYPRLRFFRIFIDLHRRRTPRRFARDTVTDWALLEGLIAAHMRAQFIGAIFGDPESTLPTTPTTYEIAANWVAAEPSMDEASYHWKS